MAAEEDEHRRRLIELHKKRFGDVIPLIRREHVSGFYARRPVWLMEQLPLERIREIGVMRAIGASDGAVLQVVIVEGVLIGMLSWLISIVLAS